MLLTAECARRRPRARCAASLAALLVAGAVSVPVAAQETRAEEIAKKQQDKAAALAPYKPPTIETVVNRLEESLASPPDGIYPAFGSVYPGGGFTLGAGYRRFYGRKAVWDVFGLYSIRNYKQIEVGTRTPWNGVGRWTLGLRAGWRDAPRVGYYGLGPDTQRRDRTAFQLTQRYAGGSASFRPTRWTRVEADVAVEDFSTDRGHGPLPSIETRFDPDTAPALFQDLTFLHTQATAAIDWRPAAGYARRGGYYGVTLVDYAHKDETFGFRRFDANAVQHMPVLRETWVISLRARLQTTLGDDDQVPFFLMPSLGGGSTLRGYRSGRFRDRHGLATSAELRWIPSRLALDMALFYDAGRVAARRGDLDFDRMKTNWGIGARFHGLTTTALRIEAARGSDGWHLVFSTNAAF